jgi:filamentous hemagglutinin family protein
MAPTPKSEIAQATHEPAGRSSLPRSRQNGEQQDNNSLTTKTTTIPEIGTEDVCLIPSLCSLRSLWLKCSLAVWALLLFSCVTAVANPVGESVTAGTVTFDRTTPGVLSIRQTTDRAIINWRDFSIGAGEYTRFFQPGANAAALNRVLGGNPSEIYGTLRANGQLILLNPAGIIVGPSGRIDAKGLVASTLNVSDEDFMNRARLTLAGNSRASVKNAGVLKAGNVYLVAREVENAGTIRASNGGAEGVVSRQLSVVSEATQGTPNVQNSKSAEVILGDASGGVAVLYGTANVKNSGLVEAALAELRAAGDNPYALAIRNSGIVRATTVANEGGRIVLKANAGVTLSNGRLEAIGDKGGEAQVLGSRVALEGSAVVDVSGKNGGGTALIGGDYRGQGSAGILPASSTQDTPSFSIATSVPLTPALSPGEREHVAPFPLPWGEGQGEGKGSEINSQHTFVGRNATIRADAKDSGDGGKVVVWSDDMTEFYGRISARGAVASDQLSVASGQFSVISDQWNSQSEIRNPQSAIREDLSQSLLTSAATGAKGGRGGFVEVSGKGSLGFDGKVDVGRGGTVLLDPRDLTIGASGASDSLLSETGLSFATGGTTSSDDKTISVSAIEGLTGNIILQADRDLTINSIMTFPQQTVGESVTFQAGRDLTINQPVRTQGASLSFSASDAGASIAATTGAGSAATATLTVNAIVGGSSTGNITFSNDGSGGIRLGDNVTSFGNVTFNHPVTLTRDPTIAAFGVTFASTINADASANNRALTMNVNGATTFGGSIGNTAALGSLTTDSPGTTTLNGTVVATTGSQSYGDPITLGQNLTLSSSGSGNVTFDSTLNGAVALTIDTSGITRFRSAVGGTAALSSLTTDSGGAIAFQGGSVSTSGAQTYNDVAVIGADTTLSSGTGNVTFSQTVNADLAANNRSLTLNGSGTNDFRGVVGGTQRLGTLTTDSGGQTIIRTSAVSAKNLTFGDAVKLMTSTTLTGTTITLNGTVDGITLNSQSLTVNADGVTTFAGVVGGTASLSGLTTDSAGSTMISANITSRAQVYNDPVMVGGDATLSSSSSVTFNSTLNGDLADTRQLTINATSATTFNGLIGRAITLKSLTTDSDGTTVLGSAVDTVNVTTLTFRDPVTLTASTTTFNGTTITLNNAVNGSTTARNLVINASGTTTIGGTIGATRALGSVTTDGGGTTVLSGGVITSTAGGATGAQHYQDAVTLGGSPGLSAVDSSITFDQTIDAAVAGARALTVTTTTTTFSGAIGSTSRLSTLTTDSVGVTAINGGSVHATTITLNDDVTLGANTVLTGSSITLGSTGKTVSGAGYTLDLNTSFVTGFSIGSGGGSGYTSEPTVTIAAPAGGGITATATAVVSGGRVTAINVTNPGSGYTSPPSVTLTGGGFTSAATASATIPTSPSMTLRSAVSVAQLSTDSGGRMTLNANVTTSGHQTFRAAVTLGAALTLTSTGSGSISLNGTVNGAFALTLNTAGTTTLSGVIGGTSRLASLTTDAPGGTTIGSSSITTTGAQTYNDPLTLTQNTTLSSTSSGAITFNQTINGATVLTVSTGGTTTFNGVVGGITPLSRVITGSSGTTVINISSITTSGTGSQSYENALTLNTSPTFTSTGGGNIVFSSTINGAQALTINTSGETIFNGRVGATTALASVTTDAAGTTVFTVSGTATSPSVTTTGDQTYNDAVRVSGSAALSAANIRFQSTVNGPQSLTVLTPSGTTTFNGAIGGTTSLAGLTTGASGSALGTVTINTPSLRATTQTYHNAILLGANLTLTGTTVTLASTGTIDSALDPDDATIYRQLTINAVNTIFNGTIGASRAPSSLTTDGGSGHTTTFAAVTITVPTQSYGDPVVLTTGATTLNATTLTFRDTVNGAQALNLNVRETATILSSVGGTTALTTLTSDSPGKIVVNSGIRAATLVFNDPVVLTSSLTFSGTTSATFASTLDADAAANNRSLNVVSPAATFSQPVGGTQAFSSVTTSGGTATISGGSITATTINLSGSTTMLGAEARLIAGTITLGAVTSSGGPWDLRVSGTNTMILSGTIGVAPGAPTVRNLIFDNGGTIVINATSINTTGWQMYKQPVTLNVSPTFTSTGTGTSGDVTFQSTINAASNGGQSLTVNTSGTTILSGTIGHGADGLIDTGDDRALSALTTDAGSGGGTLINTASIKTTGNQTFNDNVTLGVNTTLTGKGPTAKPVFNGSGTPNVIGSGYDLTLNFPGAGVGNETVIDGAKISGVRNLTVGGNGDTKLTGTISTTGHQLYHDAVTLTANTVLKAATITFNSTVAGATFDLTLTGTGLTTLNGNVSDVGAFVSDGGGSIAFNAPSVSATTINAAADTVLVTANATLTGTTSVTLSSVASNRRNLTVSTATLNLNGPMSGVQNLSVTGTTAINLNHGIITTTGTQVYSNPVTLAAATTLTSTGTGSAGNITLSGAVNGAFAFTVNTAGTATFTGLGGTTSLTSITTDAAGSTVLNVGTVTAVNAIAFNDAVTLGANTTVTSTSNQNITFGSTINGNFSLTLNTTGTTTLGGHVGNTTALASLTTNAGGTVAINGGSVNTGSGAQTYNENVTLGADVVFTGGTPTFGETVAANNRDLTLNFSGTTTINPAVFTNLRRLVTGNGGVTELTGNITTSDTQSYGDAVTLTGATTLRSTAGGTSANITFGSTVNGNFALSILTGGELRILGNVGNTASLTSLTTDVGGRTLLGPTSTGSLTITTSGAQTYGDSIELFANTTLTGSVVTRQSTTTLYTRTLTIVP